jgi:hypothetical protein
VIHLHSIKILSYSIPYVISKETKFIFNNIAAVAVYSILMKLNIYIFIDLQIQVDREILLINIDHIILRLLFVC